VKYDMGHPFDFDLRVELEVDAKIGDNWYECK
jgi:DNA polymerase I-like protein with 3'-5' exonuclease and polymerase domains